MDKEDPIVHARDDIEREMEMDAIKKTLLEIGIKKKIL